MNERIKSILIKAGANENTIQTLKLNTYFDPEKFAELIVQECIGCCEQVISDPVPESVDTWLNGGEQCIQEIKQHFGIKE